MTTITQSRTIWYDPQMQQEKFLELLTIFGEQIYTIEMQQALGSQLLNQVREEEGQVRARLKKDFFLLVMGDFKRGKSTLINALLGMSILPTNVAPETVTINHIIYAPEVTVEAHLTDGGRIHLSLNELDAEYFVPIVAKLPDKHGKSKKQETRVSLNGLRHLLTNHFDLSEIHDLCFELSINYDSLPGNTLNDKARELILYLQRRGGIGNLVELCLRLRPNVSLRLETVNFVPSSRRLPDLEKVRDKVGRVVVGAPVDWLRDMRLIDTPGTGDLLYRFDEQVYSYLPQADTIIYIISALSPLSESERAFLQLSVLPQDFPKLFFVVNMMDHFRTEREVQRLLTNLRMRINTMFPGAHLFGISALDELCRLQGEKRPNATLCTTLEKAFDAFRFTLNETILLNRDVIQLERAVVQAEHMLAELGRNLRHLRRAFDTDQARLTEAIAQCEDKNSELHNKISEHKQIARQEIDFLADEAVEWLVGFVEKLATVTVPSLSGVKIDDVRRHFHFFLTDAISKAINICLEAHQPAILKLIDQARSSAKDAVHRLTESFVATRNIAPLVAQATLSETAWNNMDSLSFLVDQSLLTILGFADELVITVASLLMQHHNLTENQRLSKYQQQLQEALPDLKDAILLQTHALYNDVAGEVTSEIEKAYQCEIEASLAAMRQAQALQTHGVERMTVVNENFRYAQTTIDETLQALTALHTTLLPEETII